MKIFKRHKGYGFWDQDIRLTKIGKLGDFPCEFCGRISYSCDDPKCTQ